mmetsp:Transcript_34170/g.108882  ORF Transcript_34170/g.108882 Transcript_34170/m.108882 type:complete len:202 (+) Transcript_34170:355-960(+)
MRVCRLVRHQHLSPRVRVKRRPAHGTRWHRDTGVRIQLLGRERSRLRWRVHAVRQGRCQPRWYPRRQVGGRRRVRRALERTALGACRLQRAGDGALPLPRTQRRPTPKLAGGHVAADLGPVGRVGAAHTPRRRRRRQQRTTGRASASAAWPAGVNGRGVNGLGVNSRGVNGWRLAVPKSTRAAGRPRRMGGYLGHGGACGR